MEVKFAKKGFHVVKASAGSGKTYRLVRDYLACCLWENNPHYFRHILAITFTNLAAQEMKERILSDVKEVAEGRGSMHGSLLEIIPIAAEELEFLHLCRGQHDDGVVVVRGIVDNQPIRRPLRLSARGKDRVRICRAR